MGLDRKDDDELVSDDPAYLSTAQAAALLGGVSTNFVVGEIRDGRLTALVIERPGFRTIYRITDAALAEYMKKFGWNPTSPAA